jgi:hypothetical protein
LEVGNTTKEKFMLLQRSQPKVNITHQGPTSIAGAMYPDRDEYIFFVRFTKLGQDILILDYASNPLASFEDACAAGDAFNTRLEQYAQQTGAERLLIKHPGNTITEFVREYRPHPSVMRAINTKPVYLN